MSDAGFGEWLATAVAHRPRTGRPPLQGPIDETSPDLDPGEPVQTALRFTVRYSERFGQQVRELGGIGAEASLIAQLGDPE